MIRNMIVCGAVIVAVAGCGSDDDATPEDEATATVPAPQAATESEVAADASGDRDAWCLGWNSALPPDDDDDIETQFEAEIARIRAMLEVAPDEIADATATLLEAQQNLGDHFAEYVWDPDTPRADPALTEIPQKEALDEIFAFAADNC